MSIVINLDKAKDIGHNIRRQKRAEEFAPLDEVIMKQIPGTNVEAIETERQAIRDKYSAVQTEIDTAETPEQIKQALNI